MELCHIGDVICCPSLSYKHMYASVTLMSVTHIVRIDPSIIQTLMLMYPAISTVRFELQSGVVCLGAKGTLAPSPSSCYDQIDRISSRRLSG